MTVHHASNGTPFIDLPAHLQVAALNDFARALQTQPTIRSAAHAVAEGWDARAAELGMTAEARALLAASLGAFLGSTAVDLLAQGPA